MFVYTGNTRKITPAFESKQNTEYTACIASPKNDDRYTCIKLTEII